MAETPPVGVVGRFAPSPSGRMHLGNVFAALLAWLSARSQGGRLVLRIEDLDPARCRPEYAQQLMDDLRWLGLDWDNGPGGGRATDAEVPRQSGRTAFYAAQLARLEALGLVYPCFCTRAQLQAASAPHLGQGEAVYGGRCRGLSAAEAARLAAQRRPALRVRVPDETITFEDGLYGPYAQNLAREAGDFILRRSDGVFAYQLAVVADDGAMGVTEVVRGRDLLPSTPRQNWLARTLGYTPPRHAHTPLLLAPDGRRLAKRERDLDLGALRARYPGPEPVLGRLAFLAGLLEADTPMAAADLVPLFNWGRVRRGDIIIEEGMF